MFERTGEYSHLRTIPVLTEVAEGAPLEIPVLTEEVEAIAQADASDSIAPPLPPVESESAVESLAARPTEPNSGLPMGHGGNAFTPLAPEQSGQFSAGLIARIETWRLDNYDIPADADWPALKQALPELIRAQFAAAALPEAAPVCSQVETVQSAAIE